MYVVGLLGLPNITASGFDFVLPVPYNHVKPCVRQRFRVIVKPVLGYAD
jgi:hypothetical protein